MRGWLHDLRPLDVQLLTVGEKGIRIEFGDLHHRLVLALGALKHLVLTGIGVGREVSDIRDVHHAFDRIAEIAQALFQHVLHDIAAQVADVRKVIDRRSAGVHFHKGRIVGNKQFLFVAQRIVKIHFIFPPVVFPALQRARSDSPAPHGPGLACGYGPVFLRSAGQRGPARRPPWNWPAPR